MHAYQLLALRAALAIAAAPMAGYGADFFWDPVVTHTNGMRLASSTSTRSHNVYWQCEAGHVGYCDGLMRSPCRDDWRSLGTRCHGQFQPPYSPAGPTSSHTEHAHDGLEDASSESLGLITSDLGGVGGGVGRAAPSRAAANLGQPAVAAPSTPPTGGVWLDALQTISQKMMAPAE